MAAVGVARQLVQDSRVVGKLGRKVRRLPAESVERPPLLVLHARNRLQSLEEQAGIPDGQGLLRRAAEGHRAALKLAAGRWSHSLATADGLNVSTRAPTRGAMLVSRDGDLAFHHERRTRTAEAPLSIIICVEYH